MMCTFEHRRTFDKAGFYLNEGWCFYPWTRPVRRSHHRGDGAGRT